jgi:two-component sensor histidine kinase
MGRIARYAVAAATTPPLPALINVLRRLCAARTIEEVIETVTPAARQMLQADGVTFVLREQEQCYYADEDAIGPLWKGRRFPIDACVSGWCMIERRPAVIGDVFQDPRIPQDAYRPTFVRSLVMVPVRQDDPIAAMGAYWREVRDASAAEVELLQAIANAAGLALTNVELRREQEKSGTARQELTHRMRNVLTVVDILARRGLSSATNLEAFGESFLGRLRALSRAQTMLDEVGRSGADLRTIVSEQLLLGISSSSRINCVGPDVYLAADEAFDLGMALHELGTNARKYGALSNETGTISIEWEIEGGGKRPMLALTWIERGGPPVRPPSTKGFGTALVQRAFANRGGSIELSFAPAGLECRMRIALP